MSFSFKIFNNILSSASVSFLRVDPRAAPGVCAIASHFDLLIRPKSINWPCNRPSNPKWAPNILFPRLSSVISSTAALRLLLITGVQPPDCIISMFPALDFCISSVSFHRTINSFLFVREQERRQHHSGYLSLLPLYT